MPVNTGINSSLLKPQTFHVITYLRGTRALEPLPQRLCLIGPKSTAGTLAVTTPTRVDDPSQIDTQAGTGSILALMARKATETAAYLGQGPLIDMVALADTTTARQSTFTLTGPATADDQLTVKINGVLVSVGIASGTNATDAGNQLRDKINELAALLPVTATAAAGVVTMTDATKGVLGNDAVFDVVHTPPGMTNTWVQTVAGAGVLDIQTALDAIAGLQYDAVAICNHASADVTELATQIATTWAPGEKRPRWFFIGEIGSISTATSLASAANHEGIEVIDCQGARVLPCQMAAAVATAALSKNRPNANYDGLRVPLAPCPQANAFTNAQCETALNAGVTPLVPVIDGTGSVVDGVLQIVRLITTRTTLNSQPYSLTRDFGVSRTAWAMAKQYDIAYARLQAQQQTAGDGMLLDEDTEDLVRDTVVDVMYAAQDSKWIRHVDANKELLVLEEDPNTIGRLNVDNTYDIVVGLHQVAYVHRAQVG